MATPPQYLLPWLTCTDYLMNKLQALSGQVALEVLQQIWCPSTEWDEHILHLDHDLVMHRDIMISAHGTPCWFARTILPSATFQANLALFERLDNEPLGNLIFQNEAVQRSAMRYYPIDPTDAEYTWVPEKIRGGQTELWMRLSTFCLNNSTSFYLAEIFLPGLETYA
ncbi:MAG: hypothetical protein CK424_08125 [Legionella sp.]|nr:MAG: hypothetical protein CK424_08125 [Legionella sp.]